MSANESISNNGQLMNQSVIMLVNESVCIYVSLQIRLLSCQLMNQSVIMSANETVHSYVS